MVKVSTELKGGVRTNFVEPYWICHCTCGSLVIDVQYLEIFFLDFHELLKKIIKNLNFMLNTIFLYQQNAHFIFFSSTAQNFNITFCKNFIGPQRSIGQQKRCNFEFQKNNWIKTKKSELLYNIYWSVLSPDFFRRILVLYSNI